MQVDGASGCRSVICVLRPAVGINSASFVKEKCNRLQADDNILLVAQHRRAKNTMDFEQRAVESARQAENPGEAQCAGWLHPGCCWREKPPHVAVYAPDKYHGAPLRPSRHAKRCWLQQARRPAAVARRSVRTAFSTEDLKAAPAIGCIFLKSAKSKDRHEPLNKRSNVVMGVRPPVALQVPDQGRQVKTCGSFSSCHGGARHPVAAAVHRPGERTVSSAFE